MEKSQIYLIGFMGAGKSAVARKYASLYDATVMEMDEYIELENGMKISEIFARMGEEAFRKMETSLLVYLSGAKNLIVSCGGGVAMRKENVELMQRNGYVVYLQAEPETIYSRVKDSHNRPLLEGHMQVDYIRELLEARRPKYEAAANYTVRVDGRRLEEICREIHSFAASKPKTES